MKKAIYPIKFIPQPKERVWGGRRLAAQFHKPFDPDAVIGESWEVSGFEDDSSVIESGWLEDNPLFDVIETYMDEMVGEDNYKRFGNEFPILVKLLDIQERLSVQVHPDDETAFDRHNSYGKTEAWYVLEADPTARIYMGFNKDLDAREFLDRCAAGTLEEVLNVVTPKKGDFFFIEAGTVHSAGGGLVIAEIQQLSDVTYRIYDWGRENNPATARQMHVDLALTCIDYRKYDGSGFVPTGGNAPSKKLVECKYFTASHESLVWAKKNKKAKHYFNYKAMKDGDFPKDGLKKPNHQMRTVWMIATTPMEEKKFGRHPTQKPIALLTRIIEASTKEGDVVFDPFMGSGTTGVAALKLGRRFVGVDNTKEYCDLAKKRLENVLNSKGLFAKF